MSRAAECECRTKFSQIDLPNTEVKETGWNDIGDGLCNWNKEEYGSKDRVGQNESMSYQILYVALPRFSVRDIVCLSGEQ